jgi:hypothetical protein
LVFFNLPMDSLSLHFTAHKLSQAVTLPTCVLEVPCLGGTPTIVIEAFSCVFSVPLRKFSRWFLKLGHNHFLPPPFQFIVR